MNPTIFSSSSKTAAVSASSSTASFFSEASASSGTQSAFAADELDGVFRIGSTNDSTQSRHDDHLARDSSLRRRRFITPSFATDGELSTFSEEENDASDASDDIQESVNSGGIHLSFRQSNRRNIFYPSRRVQSPLSGIFRMPISGAKRQCEDIMMDDGDQKVNTTNTRPLLCRANHICSSDDNSDDYSTSSSSEESLDDQVMSSPRSSKRMCLSRNDSPSSYISLFSVTSPATIDYRGADSAIITPKRLEHPLADIGSLIES